FLAGEIRRRQRKLIARAQCGRAATKRAGQAKVRRCLVAPLHALHAVQCNADGFRWVKRCNAATPPPARPTRPHEARKPPSILRMKRRFSGMSSTDVPLTTHHSPESNQE